MPPRWALAVRRTASEVVLAPQADGMLLAPLSRPSLVVWPGDDPRLIVEKLRPGAVAMNAPAVEEAGDALASVESVRIFRDDITRFELRGDGVRLPTWTRPAYSSDSERS
jgi:hypothetical protein